MFPFEPSFIGIALLVAITVIIILYVTLLLRLKPPTETTIKRPPKKEPSTKEPVKPLATQPELSVEEQKSPKRPTVPGKTKSAILVEISETPEKPSEHIEAPESTEETPASARPPECPHYFGYLKKLPKNAQIPDECLGCPRLVECIHSTPMLEQS